MKNKAPLAMMEQLVMVLVFALAAAVCLQVFALSDRVSRSCADRDRAVTAAQSAAETLKSCSGDYETAAAILGGIWNGESWSISYDENWQQTGGSAAHLLTVTPTSADRALLGSAEITAAGENGEPLYTLTVAWQEVNAHE